MTAQRGMRGGLVCAGVPRELVDVVSSAAGQLAELA